MALYFWEKKLIFAEKIKINVFRMKFKSIFITICAAGCICLSGMAQTARQVLDQTASVLKKKEVIEVHFEGTHFNGLEEAGKATGKITLKGSKFKIESDDLTTWFDGRTQWTLLNGSDEVNVDTPNPVEMQRMNPYTFVDLYKEGYNLKVTDVTYQEKSCHEVRLIAQTKQQDIQLLIAVIDKNTHLPQSIRIKDGRGEWVRIRVQSLRTLRKVGDDFFKFDTRKHPGIEVIDLR